jgi:hypothetical protein
VKIVDSAYESEVMNNRDDEYECERMNNWDRGYG